MKTRQVYLAALLAGVVWLPLGSSAQGSPGLPAQAFSGAVLSSGAEGDGAAASAPDSDLYADGTRAIHESRWGDAAGIFAKIASQHGEHSDGALYWKAYAENELGQASRAVDSCVELNRDYPASHWIEDCGALEIQIHAKSGKPVAILASDGDELKLLKLNLMMREDEPRALAEIQEILNGDSSEKLKNEAYFILGQHYSDVTYAEIVRISYVEGDVRISRGKENEKETGATWEKAAADLPLETGFSLVTGTGRAEIELEDASTLYLGENSVLTFNDMHTTGGVPYTEIALLTGTVTLHVRPYVAGELIVLKTPTDEFTARYPFTSNLRITSYADATAIASQVGGILYLPGMTDETLALGQTAFYREDRRIDSQVSIDPTTFAEWDKWVADRVAQRATALAEVMKASGLASPIPGMADMYGRGTFFECAPYGTCWEPTAANDQRQQDSKLPEARPSSAAFRRQPAHLVRTGFDLTPRFAGTQAMQAGSPDLNLLPQRDIFFPCLPASIRYRTVRDPATGREHVVSSGLGVNPVPWDWAVCHAGSWIQRRHHYVWVAGHKRHHLEPVRWVKSGHKVAFVPIHPYDVKGRPPINRKEEVFAINDKNGLFIQKVRFDTEHPIEFLKSPPREFRTAYLPPLAHAEEPRMEAHQMRDAFGNKGTLAKAPGIPLSFDRKSESFMMARQVMQGSKSVTVMAPVTNHSGNLQARGGSFSGGGGFRGGGSSGGSGSHGGSSSGGGGSHGGGGGASSGGGGSHGGGGGGGSSSGGSSGGASSAGSSSGGASSGGGGGGHH